MKKPTKPSVTRTITYIVKDTQNEYRLQQLTLEGDQVVEDKTIHKDLPNIVYAKLIEILKRQAIHV